MHRGSLTALCLTTLLVGAAYAADPQVEFLRAMQRAGYGELSLQYLEQIASLPEAPAAVQETLDLERSRSLRIAANEAYDAEERGQRLSQADSLLNKFIDEHPEHPASADALMELADEAVRRAQSSIGMSEAAKDKAAAAQLRATARAQLMLISKRLDHIIDRLRQQIDKAGKATEPADAAKTSTLTFVLLEFRLKAALIDYFMAQTYPEPKDPSRKKHLESALKAFNAIFQEQRIAGGGGLRVAMAAHMWQGKMLEELGNDETALDVYDEVLVLSPEKDGTPEDAALFGQAALFRLRLMRKSAAPAAILREGAEWLRANKFWEETPSYQGIAFELAKIRFERAERTMGADRKNLLREAVTALLAVSKVESPYQHEALLLHRKCQDLLGGPATISADQEIALGDAAAAARSWAEATASYERALDAAQKKKDTKAADTAKGRLTYVRFQLAVEMYAADNFERSLQAAGAIVRDAPSDPIAAMASGLAVAAALELYTAATGSAKAKALERLERVANYTIEHWPDKGEADDARMALVRVKLLQSDQAGALEILGKVQPKSKRYGSAQYLAGQLQWKQYADAKRSKDAALAEKLPMMRAVARERLTESVAALRNASVDLSISPKSSLFSSQLLLGEIHMEEKSPEQAAKLFDPLVESLSKSKPQKADAEVLRAFIGAVQAHLAIKQPAAAGAAAAVLANIGGDDERANGVLVDFVRVLLGEHGKAAAELSRLEGAMPPDAAAAAQARQTRDSLHASISQVVQNIAAREAFTSTAFLYLGDAALAVGQDAEARSAYERALARFEKASSPAEQKQAARARAQLIRLLRKSGKHDEALAQAEALIKLYPNALEPLLEKGNILQARAELAGKGFDECVEHWSQLRQRLGRSQPRPPEYYEVLYNAAWCSWQSAQENKDSAKTLAAEQMLNSTLTLTPKLSGPEMVAKYNSLLAKLESARVKSAPQKK